MNDINIYNEEEKNNKKIEYDEYKNKLNKIISKFEKEINIENKEENEYDLKKKKLEEKQENKERNELNLKKKI